MDLLEPLGQLVLLVHRGILGNLDLLVPQECRVLLEPLVSLEVREALAPQALLAPRDLSATPVPLAPLVAMVPPDPLASRGFLAPQGHKDNWGRVAKMEQRDQLEMLDLKDQEVFLEPLVCLVFPVQRVSRERMEPREHRASRVWLVPGAPLVLRVPRDPWVTVDPQGRTE